MLHGHSRSNRQHSWPARPQVRWLRPPPLQAGSQSGCRLALGTSVLRMPQAVSPRRWRNAGSMRADRGCRRWRPGDIGEAEVDGEMPPAPVDQNGEIARSFLRRQPVRIVAGRVEGGYTGAFEVICCDCGDNPYLGYSEISPRLQRLRGPYTLREGVAAYMEHLAGPLVVPDASPSEESPRRLTVTRRTTGRTLDPCRVGPSGHLPARPGQHHFGSCRLAAWQALGPRLVPASHPPCVGRPQPTGKPANGSDDDPYNRGPPDGGNDDDGDSSHPHHDGQCPRYFMRNSHVLPPNPGWCNLCILVCSSAAGRVELRLRRERHSPPNAVRVRCVPERTVSDGHHGH